MRAAVFSDVHGNLTALEAVFEDINRRSVDMIVFAGDLCVVGPRPAACIQRLQETQIASIYGNTDDWILNRQASPQHLTALAQWTMEQLDDSQRRWLDQLPFSHRISPSNLVEDDLLVVHANPIDVNQVIFPSEEEQLLRYGRLRQKDTELDNLVKDMQTSCLAFGHLHIPNIRRYKQWKLYNISSVSMPGDGDPRAKYGLFTWDGGAWSFEKCAVTYDIMPEIEAYRRLKPPGWENIVQTIKSEGCFPQKV